LEGNYPTVGPRKQTLILGVLLCDSISIKLQEVYIITNGLFHITAYHTAFKDPRPQAPEPISKPLRYLYVPS
jgi:hypothetical protein